MADRNIITPELCRQLLRYEPETGKLFWLPRPLRLCKNERAMRIWNNRFAGSEAFTASDSRGYKNGAIFAAPFFAHRVIWAIHAGVWPIQIDHINGDRADNRIVNLRNVTATMNMRNRTRYRNRKSGLMGVYQDRASGNWRARICDFDLGTYLTQDEAIAARKAGEICLGFSANHGRPK